jgi:HTH-type transcriptional regulator/antitoxin HigA
LPVNEERSAVQPAILKGPGWRISRELDQRGWSQKDLAEVIGRPLQAVNEILNGSKRITPDTAVQLGHAFRTGAEFWANLEALYRVRLAMQTGSLPDIERRSRLYHLAPVGEMMRRHWIPHTNDIDRLEAAICRFFGIDEITDDPPSPVANLRHTPTRTPEARAQLAWVKRAESLARLQQARHFDAARFVGAAPELFSLAAREEDAALLPGALHDLGVRFVIVPHLAKTYLDGAAFRVNAKPVIALTLRFDRLDYLWFTVAHEAAHIARSDQSVLDTGKEQTGATERAANSLAARWLIEPKAYRAFREATADRPTRAQIEAFAERIDRHPSIIVGRLQHDDVISFSQHRWAHVAVRHLLSKWIDWSPNAA